MSMTDTPIENMTAEELVHAVATEVMGWRQFDSHPEAWSDALNKRVILAGEFNPLTRYDSAGLVIGAMESRGYGCVKSRECFQFFRDDSGAGSLFDSNVAGDWRRALCEAALLAVRSEK